MVDMAIASRIF